MTGPERIHPDIAVKRERVLAAMPDDDATAAAAARDGQRGRWRQRIPRRFHQARVGDLTGWAGHDDLAEWACADHPTNLLLIGPVGVGKTHAAVASVREHFAGGAGLEFVPVGEMLDRLDWRRPDSHDYLDHLLNVDLLVVDDLGTERSNEWTGERLYTLVNGRWLNERPLVATTNMEPAELGDAIGERTYSRLVGGALVLRLTGNDRRRRAT